MHLISRIITLLDVKQIIRNGEEEEEILSFLENKFEGYLVTGNACSNYFTENTDIDLKVVLLMVIFH